MPVNEMLLELVQVEADISNLKHLINYSPISIDVRTLAQIHLLVKVDHRNTLNWLLEEEFINGVDIEELFIYNNIKNLQRAKI